MLRTYLNEFFIFSCFFEAASDRGFNVASSECCEFSENSWNLDAIVQKETQFAFSGSSVLISNQSEHV
jgi:hypothetical protein